MIRLVLLVALVPATALAQTADVIREYTGTPVRERSGSVTTVTYDLLKLVKGKDGLKSVDEVKRRLIAGGYLLEASNKQAGDPVEELPKCQLRVTAPESIHAGIREAVEPWNPNSDAATEKRKLIEAKLARQLPPVPPAVIFPPPVRQPVG